MITEAEALKIVKPLATMSAQFGQEWNAGVYAKILVTYGRAPETARKAIESLISGGSERPTPADVRAALATEQPSKTTTAGRCALCGGTGWVPVLIMRTQHGGDSWSNRVDEIITMEDCMVAQGSRDGQLAMMKHYRALQKGCAATQTVAEARHHCACRTSAEEDAA